MHILISISGSSTLGEPPHQNVGHSPRSSGRYRVFPHKREDGGFEQLDLLVLREDEFGCFTPLLGVLPSVFVQAVSLDLQEEGIVRRKEKKTEGKRKKERKKFRSIWDDRPECDQSTLEIKVGVDVVEMGGKMYGERWLPHRRW